MIRIYLTLTYFFAIIVLKMRKHKIEDQIMEKIGIIKGFDKLGRIVIPKELRERFSLNDEVEIVATEEGVLLRNPKYRLVRVENDEK